MIVPANKNEADWRGRTRRRLTVDLFTRYGPFWTSVAALRERWHVSPTVDVPPAPAFGIGDVGLPSDRMPERFHMPEVAPFATTDTDELVRLTGAPGLADHMRAVDRRLAVRLFLDDMETLWKASLGDDVRSGTNVLGWMSWTPFLSACVLYDPPPDALLKYAEHDDHHAAARSQRAYWQDAELHHAAWTATPPNFARLRESFVESDIAPTPKRGPGNPKTDDLENVQAALWKRSGMTYLQVAEAGGWHSHTESTDPRDRKNRVIARVKAGERILQSREYSG